MARLIGVFGGTFDPVHFGHLRPALDVLQSAELNEVRFIPNRVPPHREVPVLDEQKRMQLVKMAIADTSGFILDTRELEREGPSYMVDTLRSLKDEFPNSHLCLMMGMDAFQGLPQWHRWQSILELCHLIITTRPGVDFIDLHALPEALAHTSKDPQCLQQGTAGQILIQSVTQLDISASQIRARLQAGHSTQFLVPEVIREELENTYVK